MCWGKIMAVDFDEVCARGGKAQHDLLSTCVLSVQPEPLFVFLVREYRAAPTAAKAVALYDVFCATDAEAPLGPVARDLRLTQTIATLRQALEKARQPPADPEKPVFVPLP